MFHEIGSPDNADAGAFGLGDPTTLIVNFQSSVGIPYRWPVLAARSGESSEILWRVLVDELAEGRGIIFVLGRGHSLVMKMQSARYDVP